MFLVVPAQTVYADFTRYETYNTSDNNSSVAYGGNWLAQTFTATSTHTVSQVKLKLFRNDTPGTVTLSLKSVDGSGHPTGEDWTLGSFNGSTATNNSSGVWYTLNVSTVAIASGSQYALVLRATEGNATSFINWRYNDAGSYSGGNYEESADGGYTWTSNTSRDFMFEIWGGEPIEIVDVEVYTSAMEPGDWYFAIHYSCYPPAGYEDADPEKFYYMQLLSDSTILAQRPLAQWGYMPMSLYLSADTVDYMGLVWGGEYTVRLIGNDNAPISLAEASHTLEDTDWIGSEKWRLCNYWIIDTAQSMEVYYSTTLTVTQWDFGSGMEELDYPILNLLGGELFLKGTPGLYKVCPNTFYVIIHDPEWDEIDYGGSFERAHNWTTLLGGPTAQIPSALNATANIFNIDGKLFGGLAFLGLSIALMAAVVGKGVMGTAPALVIGVLVLTVGTWLGFIAYALMAVLSAIVVTLMVWVLWFRST